MFVAMALLLAAIVIEVIATSLLPKADGFRDPGWTLAVMAGYTVSIWLLTIVVRTVPVSIAYAIRSGLGTAVVAVVGYLYLGESMGALKAVSLALIVVGVVGLNLVGAH